MKSKIFQNLSSKISKNLSPGSKIVYGLSGGSDSIALLHYLNENFDFEIKACHYNHSLRSKESDEDEAFVRDFCAKLKIDLVVVKKDIIQLSKKLKKSIEETARDERKLFFEENLINHKAKKIILAHHLDDQIETFLMRLIRGTGLTGLSSMKEISDNYFRPLLSIEKKEIIEYLKKNKLNWREDESNSDIKFTRNFIRHKILNNVLNLNPNFKHSFNGLLNNINLTNNFLNDLTDEFINKNLIKNKNILILKTKFFIDKPKALKYLVIKNILEKILGNQNNIIFKNIDDSIKLIESEKVSGKINISKNIFVEKGYDKIFFYDDKNIFNNDFDYEITNLRTTKFSHFLFSVTHKPNLKGYTYFDISSFDVLSIRSFKKGDKMKFPNRGITKKVHDLFIDYKIPRFARKYLPLVIINKKIIKIFNFDHMTVNELKKNNKKLVGIKISSSFIKKLIN